MSPIYSISNIRHQHRCNCTYIIFRLSHSIEFQQKRFHTKVFGSFYDSFEQAQRISKIRVIQGDTAVKVRLIEKQKCTLANRINPDQTGYLTDDQNDKQLTRHVID